MTTDTRAFDVAEHLETAEDIATYLTLCFEENDPGFIPHALGTIARARGMTDIARRTGLSRESLYRALADNGNPNLSTLLKVCEALGLKLTLTAA